MSWQNSTTLYLIMYRSKKTGGTYSALRKTDEGRDRFLRTLAWLGFEEDEITVVPQERQWKPTTLGGRKKTESLDPLEIERPKRGRPRVWQ